MFFLPVVLSHILYRPDYSNSTDPVALVFLTRKDLNVGGYNGFVKQIQSFSHRPLWLLTSTKINSKWSPKKWLKDQGAPDIPVYLMGHSDAGFEAQKIMVESQYKDEYKGLILIGSTIARRYRDQLSVPMLSIHGEMDGLSTPMRQAEEYHFKKVAHTVVLLPFLTHFGIYTGSVPKQLAKLDIIPQVTKLETYRSIAEIINEYLTDTLVVNNYAKEFYYPLIAAMEFEGSYFLRPPCNSDFPSPHCPYYPTFPPQNHRPMSNDSDCRCSSDYTLTANEFMSGIDKNFLYVTDAFHPVSQINPLHHPHIWNNCTGIPNCVVNMTTITENVYYKNDQSESLGAPVAAMEVRMKLKSRQAAMAVTLNDSRLYHDFDKTDPITLCKELNEYSYYRALSMAAQRKVVEWNLNGVPIEFLPDQDHLIEPLFTNSPLIFKQVFNKNKTSLVIQSPSLRVAMDNIFAMAGGIVSDDVKELLSGYHYCKVTSPARLLEWIYTEGLRSI